MILLNHYWGLDLQEIDWQEPFNMHEGWQRYAFRVLVDELGMTQCVSSPTCGRNMLDLLMISHPDDLKRLEILPPITTSTTIITI